MSSVTPVASEAEAGPLSHRRTLIIIGALLLGMLLAALDQTIVATEQTSQLQAYLARAADAGAGTTGTA